MKERRGATLPLPSWLWKRVSLGEQQAQGKADAVPGHHAQLPTELESQLLYSFQGTTTLVTDSRCIASCLCWSMGHEQGPCYHRRFPGAALPAGWESAEWSTGLVLVPGRCQMPSFGFLLSHCLFPRGEGEQGTGRELGARKQRSAILFLLTLS